MKPCARVDKGRIPTLQDIVWIIQVAPEAMQSITCFPASKFKLGVDNYQGTK